MPKFRGFIAIDINPTPKIIQFEKEIENTGADVKLVKPENIHITLKFLGDVDEEKIDQIEKIINDSSKNTDPFTIKLKGSGVFPNQNYIKVIWIGIKQGEPIGIIAGKIDEQLSKMGFKKEKRGFSPHLSIARVKSAKGKDEILQIIEKYKNIKFADIVVDSIKLKKSDLTKIIKYKPEVLIIGTGAYGILKVPSDTKHYIESNGIELIINNTRKACDIYNVLKDKKKVVAALHLTC